MTDRSGARCIGHVTAHLGGGIGQALAHLIRHDSVSRHEIITIEQTKNRHLVDAIEALNVPVRQFAEIDDVGAELSKFDIVQVEYWNNPLIYMGLSQLEGVKARWVAWCHISGRGSPAIPENLPDAFHACAVSTPYSLEQIQGDNVYLVPSAAGLSKPEIKGFSARSIDGLYLGTLSPAKIHSDYVRFLARFIKAGHARNIVAGEVSADCSLPQQIAAEGLSDAVAMPGHVSDVQTLFQDARYFLYILNPNHYGTSENALIEAMSAGVVPIILNNPVETHLVPPEGAYVIRSPKDLAGLAENLADKARWREMSNACLRHIEENYQPDRTAKAFEIVYDGAMKHPPRPFPFSETFGGTPREWFLSTRADKDQWCESYLSDLMERGDYAVTATSKGSLTHFLGSFLEDPVLQSWAQYVGRENRGSD